MKQTSEYSTPVGSEEAGELTLMLDEWDGHLGFPCVLPSKQRPLERDIAGGFT